MALCHQQSILGPLLQHQTLKKLFLLPQMDMLPLPQSILSDISISECDVYTALASLDPQKSMGIDGIGPKVLKWCALALHKPFHHLFLLTFSQNHLPEEWRTHLITPIHKSGDQSTVKKLQTHLTAMFHF